MVVDIIMNISYRDNIKYIIFQKMRRINEDNKMTMKENLGVSFKFHQAYGLSCIH